MVNEYPKEKVELILQSMTEEQLEFVTFITAINLTLQKQLDRSIEQTGRLLKLLQEEGSDHDLEHGWKEADHEWDRDEQGPPYGTQGEGDDGRPLPRREPEGDAVGPVEHGTEDR